MASIHELQAALQASEAEWVADETPLSHLTLQGKMRRLGVVVDRAALGTAMAPRAQVAVPKFDPAVDWRDRNGNYITPVKDQGGCGSCISFASIGTVEAIALIELRQSLNLSEADLHFCSDHGATCNGWWLDAAYHSFQTRGVADEASFPYSSAFNGSTPFCSLAADRDRRAVRVTNSTTLQSITERKNWLTQVGPCTAVFRVFDDFFSYRQGVYRHVSGNDVGLHSVVIIGYSDAEQCWIAKNSWGTAWGDRGFFRIGYGEAGIDTEFPFWTARGVKLPPPPPDNGVRYDGIWVPANDGRPIVWGWTWEDLQKKNDECYRNGYRLMYQQRYDWGGGQIRYDGIWELGNDGRPIVWGWTWKDFNHKNSELYAQGYRLTHQQRYDVGGGQIRYDGIWTPGSDSRPIVWSWTFEDFQKKNGECYSSGYRLAYQQRYDIGDGQINSL